MRQGQGRSRWVSLWYVALACAILPATGCAAVLLGTAAAGGAAGYAYYRGNVGHEFRAGFSETWTATQAALGDLGLPVLVVKNNSQTEGEIESRTGDGTAITVRVETHMARLPADGVVTRVGIRVGHFGDAALSNQLGSQIQWHLTQPHAAPNPQLMQPIVPVPQPLQPAAAAQTAPLPQTAPPPLDPDAPTPKK